MVTGPDDLAKSAIDVLSRAIPVQAKESRAEVAARIDREREEMTHRHCLEETDRAHMRGRDNRVEWTVLGVTVTAFAAGLFGAFSPFASPDTQRWACQLVTIIVSGGVSF